MPRSRSTRISSRRISRTSIRKTSASSLPERATLLAALLLFATAGPAAAQVRLQGRVVRADATDSTPLAGAWVVLHEVRMASGGPRDSVRTGRDGGFRMTVQAADTSALYMVSTTFRGLTYFSEVRTARDTSGPLEPLVVYDTSSTEPPVGVAQRHIVVRSAEGGRRSVMDLVALANDGSRTRVAGEPPRPTWVGRIAAGATNFTVGQSDVSAEAMRLVGDSVVVTAPIPPGVKQLVFTYDVAGGRELRFPMDQPAERLLVLLQDTGAVATAGPVMKRGTEVFNDTQFAVFSGAVTAAGVDVVFTFDARGWSPGAAATAIIAAAAALLLLLAILLVSRRAPAVVRALPPETPDELARAIAVLDAEHERGGRGAADVAAYQAQRAALKQRLSELLARPRPGA